MAPHQTAPHFIFLELRPALSSRPIAYVPASTCWSRCARFIQVIAHSLHRRSSTLPVNQRRLSDSLASSLVPADPNSNNVQSRILPRWQPGWLSPASATQLRPSPGSVWSSSRSILRAPSGPAAHAVSASSPPSGFSRSTWWQQQLLDGLSCRPLLLLCCRRRLRVLHRLLRMPALSSLRSKMARKKKWPASHLAPNSSQPGDFYSFTSSLPPGTDLVQQSTTEASLISHISPQQYTIESQYPSSVFFVRAGFLHENDSFKLAPKD
ncbi:uncharacterized protein UV8b_01263 [Ustilaginoidea virens]|uniref:Uncharacterized protein n=1 Tax=Ustilaginoidea virens TaxID=1159556 RepID=A0A8E5HKL5_USTVR|nr:uncharacterized protein UV8b_01263 [Ustilaginoidea virens]QUC17022.1 hypothetical protein UV8b_01263 [Ustilaginoidea virens]